ncbi:MAG: hypothetical protein H8E48_00130 [Chloroflexi bacterium]|nr:hypothetical protein [Chloroflexota bacterium]
MDPSACWLRFLAACDDEDTCEAYHALSDLSEWFKKGGFRPKDVGFPKAGAIHHLFGLHKVAVAALGIDVS